MIVNDPPDHTIEGLLAAMPGQLAQGIVPLAIYGDPHVYALELARIFGRNWLFVAHESEIAKPGDYVVRQIADGRWIVVRDSHGEVRVLFDSCRHRGTSVCRSDSGNTKVFLCPYHGWTYRNDGELIGVPGREDAYGGDIDGARWGLLAAPQIAVHRGTIWVNLDPHAPSFLDHLGDYRWYFDVNLGPDSGMEVIGDPHRSILPANWKAGAENFAGDSVHTQFLHKSVTEVGLTGSFAGGQNDVQITECSGHSTSIRRTGPTEEMFWGYPPEVHRAFRESSLSPAQIDLARSSLNTVGTVFPNVSWIQLRARYDPEKPAAGVLSLRQWQPLGPDSIEMWNWILVPKVTSQEYQELAYRAAMATFSPSGNFEQDDTIVWGGIPKSAQSVFARSSGATLNYRMGLPPGDAHPIADWPGPGNAFSSRFSDGTQRTFLNHWIKEMTRP